MLRRQRAGEHVDVLSLQRQRFGLPEVQGEGDGPARGVADVRRCCQDGAGFDEVQGGGDVARRWAGGSTSAATLRGTWPRWTATVRAGDRILW
jgi:hypothetical protein